MDAATIATMVGSSGIIGAFIRYTGKAVWDVSKAAASLSTAVQANTSATDALADEFKTFSGSTTAVLNDHSTRITRLEGHQSP